MLTFLYYLPQPHTFLIDVLKSVTSGFEKGE